MNQRAFKVFSGLALLLAFAASTAMGRTEDPPPFLFTPETVEIRESGRGYTVRTDEGTLDVQKIGPGFHVTGEGRDTLIYRETGRGWTETPGGRTWTQDRSGNWNVTGGRGYWTLSALSGAGGYELRYDGSVMSWRRFGGAWMRQ